MLVAVFAGGSNMGKCPLNVTQFSHNRGSIKPVLLGNWSARLVQAQRLDTKYS